MNSQYGRRVTMGLQAGIAYSGSRGWEVATLEYPFVRG